MKRLKVQLISLFVGNIAIFNFFSGNIYTGFLKRLCFPGLNCYSCPGAIMACPIGAMQAVGGSPIKKFAFYVSGYTAIIALAFGRMACGWICPFGLIQDALKRLSKYNITIPKSLTFLKYINLLFLVLILPEVMRNEFGMGEPYFCKWLCPVGVIEGSTFLLFFHQELRQQIGVLFTIKLSITSIFIFLMIVSKRPFCRTMCPLGAIYGIFNTLKPVTLERESDCTECGECLKSCPVDIKNIKDINSSECILCFDCRDACSRGYMHAKYGLNIFMNRKRQEKFNNV